MRKTKNQSCHKNLGATILIKMEKSQKARKRLFGKWLKTMPALQAYKIFKREHVKFFTDQTKKYPIQEV